MKTEALVPSDVFYLDPQPSVSDYVAPYRAEPATWEVVDNPQGYDLEAFAAAARFAGYVRSGAELIPWGRVLRLRQS